MWYSKWQTLLPKKLLSLYTKSFLNQIELTILPEPGQYIHIIIQQSLFSNVKFYNKLISIIREYPIPNKEIIIFNKF